MKDKDRVLRIIRELGTAYKYDFAKWAEDCIDFSGLSYNCVTEQQKTIADAIINNKRVSVSGGGGLGKSAIAAMLIIWFMSTRPNTKVPTTAPTSNQLLDVLWPEMGKWMDRYKYKAIFERTTKRMWIKGWREWFSTARTVPKDSKIINDTMAGFHAENLLFIVDEASGVPDAVFTAIDGAMTQEDPYILLISNPVSFGGYYYDTITDPTGKGYLTLHMSSLESPIVDKSYEKIILARYGRDSSMYRAKVLGLPVAFSENTVLTPADYDFYTTENKSDQEGTITLGVDVGETSDPTVICCKRGNAIFNWETIQERDNIEIAKHVLNICQRLPGFPTVIVDAIGVGSGCYNYLLQFKSTCKAMPFKGSEKPDDEASYRTRRAEGYFLLKKNFCNLHFPKKPPEELRKELCNTIFDMSSGRIDLEPKKKLISRISHSPNYADALMMANYPESCFVDKPVRLVNYKSRRKLSERLIPAIDKHRNFARFL